MRRFKVFVAAVTAILIMSALAPAVLFSASDAAGPKLLKVGYVNNYGMAEDKNGMVQSGYCYDYLMEVAKYTGWSYEFVPVEWDEGMEKLKTGEIDLFGPLQKTEERMQYLDFPDGEMGFEYDALFVESDDQDIFYEDAQAIDGIRVGVEKNIFQVKKLEGYCQENEISVEYVYTKISEYERELKSGNIDAFLSGSMIDIPDTAVAAKISSEPFYYATWKGNKQILDDLNKGLNAILKADIYFDAKLDEKYYGNKSISMPAFTRDEMEYLKKSKPLIVACDPEWAPIEYFDKKKGTFQGINMDVLAELSRISGLKFEYKNVKSYEESKELIAEGQADILMGYTHKANKKLNVYYTEPFLEVPVLIVGKNPIDLQQDLNVALRKPESTLAQDIMREFPNFKYEDFHDSDEVFEAIRTGKAEAAFIGTYVYDELAREDKYDELVTVTTNIKFPQAIGVGHHVDPRVLSILDKCIKRLPDSQISAIVFANTVNRSHALSLSDTLRKNSLIIIGLLLIFVAVVLIISKRHRSKLEKIAFEDPLTGALTYAKFKLSTGVLMKNSKPEEYLLISMDIDDFKYINNSFGHEIGDEILRTVAGYLKENLKHNELLGRNTADNFVFLAKNVSLSELAKFRGLLQDAMLKFNEILPEHYTVTMSVGSYLIVNCEESVDEMLDKANVARKSIKGNTSVDYAEYTVNMDLKAAWKKEVTLSMEQALYNKEFQVYLQPKYLLSERKLVGAEALIRWKHPENGMMYPADFIPIFEQNGFITKLDYYVFEQVCELLKKWRELGEAPLVISVNLSRLHLHNIKLADELVKICSGFQVTPEEMEIELTESIVFTNTELLLRGINELKRVGFQISIDDFGSGYSSLNMLKDLPVDVIKLDKGFFGDTVNFENGRVIIEAVTHMANRLKLSTVAEGVETEEQVEMLVSMGCEIGQGYYFSRPIPIVEFEALRLAEGKNLQ